MRFLSVSSALLSLAGLAAAGHSHSRRADVEARHELIAARDVHHELEARGLPAYSGKLPKNPLFVYNAAATGLPPNPAALKGWNMYAMSFWRTDGPFLNAITWSKTSKSKQKQILKEYQKAGVKLMVAAFGDGDTPTTSKKNPVVVAKNLAKWVKANNVEGVDVDYEDFDACWAQTCANWVIQFHTTLRKQLGAKYIITHAPVAPWFTTDDTFAGGYMKVHKAVGSSIDLYLMQFYNQGKDYVDCQQMIVGGGSKESRYHETALFEMINNGIPKEKILIGKPATTKDAGSGYTPLKTLHQCVELAKSKGWNTGVMAWAWPHARDADYLQIVWKS